MAELIATPHKKGIFCHDFRTLLCIYLSASCHLFAAGSPSRIPRHPWGVTTDIPGDHLLIHSPRTPVAIPTPYPPSSRGIVR